MNYDPADYGYRMAETATVPEAIKARVAAILADPEAAAAAAGKATMVLYDEGKPDTGFLLVGDDKDAMIGEWLDTEGDEL